MTNDECPSKETAVRNYALEHLNKHIRQAGRIKVDLGVVGYECLDEASNEGQSECHVRLARDACL